MEIMVVEKPMGKTTFSIRMTAKTSNSLKQEKAPCRYNAAEYCMIWLKTIQIFGSLVMKTGSQSPYTWRSIFNDASPRCLITIFIYMHNRILDHLSFVSISHNNVIPVGNNSWIGKLGERVK